MALRIKDERYVPTGMYQSVLGGVSVSSRTMEGLRQKVVKEMEKRGLVIPGDLYQRLVDENCRRAPDFCVDTEPPSMVAMMKTAAVALKRWALSGFQVTSEEEMAKRQAVCGSCHYWSGHAVFGVGRCMKCGCTGLKLGVATERCPIGKW